MSFLISPQRRAIILPDDVSGSVPSAQPLDYQGKRLFAVPYKTWETQVLRTMGYKIPSPIGTYYTWPRERTSVPQPFHNQIETAAFLSLFHRSYCLNEIGTGKTLALGWAADWLMLEKLIRKVLIVSPLSTLDRVWGDMVFTHLGHRSIGVLHGTAAKRRKLFANDAFDFYVINHDGLDIICDLKYKEIRGQPMLIDAKLMRDDIDLVIVDEIGSFRNKATNRWRVLDKMMRPHMWGWGVTGTPIPQEPADAYAQIKLLTPDRVPKFFTEFRQSTMQQLTEYVWVPRKEAPVIVYKAMQPSIRYTRDQCFDLPPVTYSTRDVPLTAEQQKHYKELQKELFTEINGGKITAVNEGVKLSKLIQIVCGVVYDTNSVAREIDCKPRVQAVNEIIEQTEHKVIVFVPFTATLSMLNRELSKHWKTAVVYGGVSKGQRDTIFTEFQHLKNPRILIADAQCMAHGLTLTEAATIVWYGPEVSNDIYTQANGRITRAGQKNNQHIIHLASTETERRLYDRLKLRGRIQGILLDMVQRGAL